MSTAKDHLNECLRLQLVANRLVFGGDHEGGWCAAESAISDGLLALHHVVQYHSADPPDDIVGARELVKDLALSDAHFAGLLQAQQYVDDGFDGGATLADQYRVSKDEAAQRIVSVYAGAVIGTIRTYLAGYRRQ